MTTEMSCNYIRNTLYGRSQWPRGLRHRSAAARLLRLWVRIPPGTWMSVCCDCCVLSGGGLCDGLITCPEESYRLCYVVVCDLETSIMRSPWPTGGCRARNKLVCEALFIRVFHCLVLSRMQLTFTSRVESLNTRDDGRGEATCRSLTLLHLAYWLDDSFITPTNEHLTQHIVLRVSA